MEKTDITIIGAGIIGLAVSASVSQKGRTVYVVEKNSSFGQENSSRNSEVIHAGIYYPQNSLKARTCVEGNRLTYQICAENNIPCKRLGKLIVAETEEEVEELEHLLQNGKKNAVPGLKILGEKEIKQLEPNIRARAALYSPSTGIVDSHKLMRHFLQKAKGQGAEFAFHSEVIAIKKEDSAYQLTVCDADGEHFSFLSRILINCSGLNSDILAEMAGIDIKEADYLLKFSKGEYFRVGAAKSRLVKHLVYPVPDESHVCLGIHATPDMAEGLRLGPDAEYIEKDKASYDVDEAKKEFFARSVNRFLPFIEASDLVADTAGIRPKLQGINNGFRDFVICHEEKRGFPGLINLIGIDSPGLTAAAAIAGLVQDLVENI